MTASVVTLRAATRTDYSAVQALLASSGWTVRSQEGWDWAFEDNPERLELQRTLGAPVATGWVLETQDGIHGYLGNLPQSFSMNGARVMGATCTSYIVQEAWRAHSVKLMRAFFTQPGVQMVYSTTANANSGPLYQLYKANALPDPHVLQTLLWVANDRVLVEYAFKRKGLSVLLPLSGVCGSLLKLARNLVGYASPPAVDQSFTIRRLQAHDIGPEFDALWQHLQEQPGMWLARSGQLVHWRFSDPDRSEDMVLLAAFDAQRLVGYVLATAVRNPRDKLPRAYLLDVIARPGASSQVVPALMQALCNWAREEGLPWVEASRFGGALGAMLATCRPHVRRLNLPSHFLRVFDKSVNDQLHDGPAWPCSAVDGDYWFGMTDNAVRPNRRKWNGSQEDHGTRNPES
jgi:hypothetical protein